MTAQGKYNPGEHDWHLSIISACSRPVEVALENVWTSRQLGGNMRCRSVETFFDGPVQAEATGLAVASAIAKPFQED